MRLSMVGLEPLSPEYIKEWRAKLKELYLSPEALQEMINWSPSDVYVQKYFLYTISPLVDWGYEHQDWV